jgi:hypothetical protein
VFLSYGETMMKILLGDDDCDVDAIRKCEKSSYPWKKGAKVISPLHYNI